jgi:hypothetical protein
VRDHGPRHDTSFADDAHLGARLERALRDEYGDQHVDVAQLLRETRVATTKRSRARRTSLIAATALAVAAVPVGLRLVQLSDRPAGTPAASVSASATPDAPPTPTETPTPVATQLPAPGVTPESTGKGLRVPDLVLEGPDQVLFDIPDSVAIPRKELPVPMVNLLDLGQYRAVPTLPGQACSAARFERMPQPVAGRSWSWAEENSNRLDQRAVNLNVTGWRDGGAARELANVAKNAGACRFDPAVTQTGLTDERWTGWRDGAAGTATAYAAQRVGDVIVGIEVTSPEGAEDALATAERLAASTAKRVADAGIDTVIVEPAPTGG